MCKQIFVQTTLCNRVTISISAFIWQLPCAIFLSRSIFLTLLSIYLSFFLSFFTFFFLSFCFYFFSFLSASFFSSPFLLHHFLCSCAFCGIYLFPFSFVLLCAHCSSIFLLALSLALPLSICLCLSLSLFRFGSNLYKWAERIFWTSSSCMCTITPHGLAPCSAGLKRRSASDPLPVYDEA